jgi:DNA mismatch endonuclease (patch repair protein)
MDTLSSAERSKRMALIGSKDSSAELKVRSLVHKLGYRFRLHQKYLPGKPDLVFPSKRKVIFIHGCFWHRHNSQSCPLSRLPKSKHDYWIPKLEKNRLRDEENNRQLLLLGWHPLIIWECQLKNLAYVEEQVIAFLESRI